MTRLIKSIVTTLYQFLNLLRGNATIREVFQHNRSIGSLRVDVFFGYDLEVYCYRRQYVKEFDRSIFRPKLYTVYDVGCRVSGDPPSILKKALQTRITFPPLASVYLEDSIHVKLLVNAYLDMIQKLIYDDVSDEK